MAKLTCIPGKATLADWKPRLYITCHPDDFATVFQPLCDLISACCACDIYYHPPSEEPITPAEQQTLLANMNLFLVPVTMDLLLKPCAAMDRDVPFAQKHHIPILPILAESGLTPLSTLPHRFGNLPYVDLTKVCDGQLSPLEHLRFHLEQLLVSEAAVMLVESLRASTAGQDPFLDGLACLFGINRNIDGAEARKLLTRAAKETSPKAMEYLYLMHDRGIGVPTDLPTAMRWASRLSGYHRQQETLKSWPLQLNYLSYLCLTYRRAGEPQASLTLAGKLYKLSADVLGHDHPQTVFYAGFLAEICYKEMDFPQLFHLRKRLYRISVEQYGKTSPATLLEAYKLSQAHRAVGENEESFELLTEVVSTYAAQHNEGDPLAMTALYSVAAQCNATGLREKALELAEKCYQLRIEHLGRNHVDTIRTLQLQARILSDQGRLQEAISKKRMVYHRFRRILGAEHPETLDALTVFALGCSALKQHTRALYYIDQVYEIYRDFYGPDFVRTKLTKNICERIRKKANEDQ